MSKGSPGGVNATWNFSQVGLPYVCVFSKVSSEKGFVFLYASFVILPFVCAVHQVSLKKIKLSSTPCKSGQQPWHCTVPTWNACMSVGKGSRSHSFMAGVWSSPALFWTLACSWAGSWIRQYPRVASDLPRLFTDPVWVRQIVTHRIPDTLICSATLSYRENLHLSKAGDQILALNSSHSN